MNVQALHDFIVEAKACCYVGGGGVASPCRAESHDHRVSLNGWHYLDSYFSGSDFAGQEVVWYAGKPVWAMNYFGGSSIKRASTPSGPERSSRPHCSTSTPSSDGSWAGFEQAFGRYVDCSQGYVTTFRGRDVILLEARKAYELDYRGGLIRS